MPDLIRWPVVPGMIWTAAVTKVHDGDTITVDIDTERYLRGADQTLGLHLFIQSNHLHIHQPVRLFGINAAELATPAGKAAQQALAMHLPLGMQVRLATWLDESDKYGRILAGVETAPGASVNQWMVDNGFAAIYYGQGPKPVPA